MNLPSSAGAVVIDANIFVSICSKEPSFPTADAALGGYASQSWSFYAPGVVVTEVLYALCQQLQQGTITQSEYDLAVEAFKKQMAVLLPPPGGDSALIQRAKEIQSGYGCSRSADCVYIALTEELARNRQAELLTFDKGMVNQAVKNAPTVMINLLPI